jgi:hypothetical protein
VKDIKLDSLEEAAFGVIEERIYADAAAAARAPANITAGRLVRHVDTSTGRPIETFTGDPNGWMGRFKAPGYSARINRIQKGA